MSIQCGTGISSSFTAMFAKENYIHAEWDMTRNHVITLELDENEILELDETAEDDEGKTDVGTQTEDDDIDVEKETDSDWKVN